MSGLSEQFVLRLRALGSGFNLPQVMEAYGPLLVGQPTIGVQLHRDLRYGPEERHVADVYEPAASAPGARPVLLFFHGGGFIRGDKTDRANVGWYFARHGIVTVVCNYRLAPASTWPSGPEDVARAAGWTAIAASRFGGDAGHMVLMGESAGAAHVAAAVLLRRFRDTLPVGFRAAILLSGAYNARMEGLARPQFGTPTPDPRNEAYFGSSPAAWDAASIVDLVDADPCRLWISFTERDLIQMQVQAGELFARLVSRHGFTPTLQVVRDHNHFSQTLSLNTGDETLGAPLRAFIHDCRPAEASGP